MASRLHRQHDQICAGRCVLCDRRAASAVEFALVMPILLLMLTGIVQFGSIFVLQNNMQNIAREVSLRLATGDLTSTGADNWAVQRLPRHVDAYRVQVVQNDDMFDVTITAPIDQAVPIDPLGFFRTGTLSARATAREVSL